MTSPLTLLTPVLPGTPIRSLLEMLGRNHDKINAALESIGTVHYFRVVVLDRSVANLQPDAQSGMPSDSLVLGVITSFDGDFSVYIHDFAAQLGDVFDEMLAFLVGGAALTPVVDNVAAFEAFIVDHDASQHVPNGNFYAAYAQTVQEILAAV